MPARTPEQCDLQLVDACNASDAEAAIALYEPSATLIPEPGKSVTGTAAIKEALMGFIALKPKLDTQVTLAVQSGDTALLHSSWTLNGTNPDGSAINLAGKGIEVVRRQPNGNWLFVIDNPWGHPA